MFPGSQVGRAIGLSATVVCRSHNNTICLYLIIHEQMSLGALFGNPIAGQIASASGGYKAVGGYAGNLQLFRIVT